MARNNYSWEKRQRELAKKKKKEEKRLKKAGAKEAESGVDAETVTETPATTPPSPS